MKTAEEWVKEASTIKGILGILTLESAQQIQLDAIKHGMTLAAKLIRSKAEDFDKEHGSTDHETGAREYTRRDEEYMAQLEELEEEIKTARDNKTEV